MKINSTKDLHTTRLKFLISGVPGSGKTSLARTINEPTIVISAEAGLLPLAGHNIDVIDISTNDEGQVIPSDQRIERLRQALAFLLTDEARAKYKWVFVDSLTEISQNLVEALQKEFPDRKETLVLYGENSKRMRAIVKAFRDLPWYNVVFTALVEDNKDELNRNIKSISMVGKIAQTIACYFDEVLFLHVFEDDEGVTKRKLVTRASEKVVAKDRSGKLNQLEDPNLQQIAAKIKGG
jgi:nucleoside-triphosphatase THEP1